MSRPSVRRRKYDDSTRAVDIRQKSLIDLKIKKKDVFKIGYYTYFVADVKNSDNVSLERQREASLYLANLFACDEHEKKLILEADYPFGWLSYDSMKWYDWERDMTNLSEHFPEIEFVLYGEGEERDDNWRAFFKNGKCIYQHAHIYYDPEPNSEDFED